MLACVQDLSDYALEHLFSKFYNTKYPGRVVVVFRLGKLVASLRRPKDVSGTTPQMTYSSSQWLGSDSSPPYLRSNKSWTRLPLMLPRQLLNRVIFDNSILTSGDETLKTTHSLRILVKDGLHVFCYLERILKIRELSLTKRD